MDNLNSQQVYTYGLQPGSYMQWTESSFLLQYVAGRKKKRTVILQQKRAQVHVHIWLRHQLLNSSLTVVLMLTCPVRDRSSKKKKVYI